MDPVGHILEIFEIFGLGIGIGHSGRLYGSGPGVKMKKKIRNVSTLFFSFLYKSYRVSRR